MNYPDLAATFYEIIPLLQIKTAKFRLPLTPQAGLSARELPPAFRSRLGYLLKGRFCPYADFKSRSCAGCGMEALCMYIRLFSPTFKAVGEACKGAGRVHQSPPRPFTLDILPATKQGHTFVLELTLFGDQTISFYRPMLESLYHAAVCLGIGKKEVSLAPGAWHAVVPKETNGTWGVETLGYGAFPASGPGSSLEDWIRVLPPVENNAEFYFRTPVQLSRLAGKPEFQVLIQSLIARLRDLKRIYCAPDNDMGHFSKQFWAKAGEVRLLSDLGSENLEWYSHHRQKQIHLGGLTGSMIFKGDLMPFLPLLAAGFFTGMGRKTVYGLGRFGTYSWDQTLAFDKKSGTGKRKNMP